MLPCLPASLLFVFCAALALLPGCTNPKKPHATQEGLTPPVFFNEGQWEDSLFRGKTPAEIRRMMGGAIETPVTLSFRAAALPSVVKELSQKTGLGIGISPDVYAAAEGRPIDLDVIQMPARHVLDWLARLLDAFYTVEDPQTIFFTRDRAWASQDRIRQRGYAIGTFYETAPQPGRYKRDDEEQKLLYVLGYCLRNPMKGQKDAKLVLDETGSRLSAFLPPRGHAKLEKIIEEMKRPRRYEPPESDNTAKERLALLQTPVLCNFPMQDVRRIADELARRAKVNIGFDYRLIKEDHRNVTLALGETTLGNALETLAKAAGLGEVVPESGRRFWLLARDQDRRLLRTTGELPWDRAVVSSYYIKPLVQEFGIELIFSTIRKAVTPGEWDSDLPVAFYQAPTGRLIVIHDEESQRAIARCIDQMVNATRPERPVGK